MKSFITCSLARNQHGIQLHTNGSRSLAGRIKPHDAFSEHRGSLPQRPSKAERAVAMWRNEHPEKNDETATINFVVTHAEDTLDTETAIYGRRGTRSTAHATAPRFRGMDRSGYNSIICHVRGFHGKGFMPSVRSVYGGCVSNGNVHYGEGQEAYAKAVDESLKLFADRLAADRAEAARHARANADDNGSEAPAGRS